MSKDIQFEYLIGDEQKFKEATDIVVAIIQYGESDFCWLTDINEVPKVEGNLIALRRIISTPTWSVADQKSGKLPEVGALVKPIASNPVPFLGVDRKNRTLWVFQGGDGFVFSCLASRCEPIETPTEKAARLEDEFFEQVKLEWMNANTPQKTSSLFELGVRAAYRKYLELTAPKGGDKT